MMVFLKENISFASIQNKILVNVGNQIITTYELKNKITTMLILNNEELNQNNINKVKKEALTFLINSKLKEEEILKFNTATHNEATSKYLDNISAKYNTDRNGLKEIFINNNISYEIFKNEIKTEFTWQRLIFNLYNNKIKLDEKEIDEELNKIITKQKQAEEYNLAEIEILLEDNANDKKKIEEIKDQINKIGFKNTAIKYSRSLSALEGGGLGWLPAQALSNIILNTVKEMNPGDISKPIVQARTVMFIKLLDKRKIKFSNINFKKMKNEIISQKKSELLNLFSNNHLSKIKNTALIKYNE